MENQPSVKQPQSIYQSSGNHSRQELFNFTKSVIDLEAVICHKSREPNQIVIQEKSPPRTLNKPQGADGFASREYHANLKQIGNLEQCSDELVISRRRAFESPSKKPSLTKFGNENGPNQATCNEPFFRNESESHKICDIHLSRVYFSQHSTNEKQAFQEAQIPDFQPISKALSSSEETALGKRKVQFDETTVMPKRSPTVESTKHLSYPNHSSSKRQYIKGLFQKPSKPVNFHRKRTLSDKYVYFLSDCGHSSTDSEKADCPRLNQYFSSNVNMKQQNGNERNLTKPRKTSKKEELYTERESDASRMQVVVDSDGRVLVNVLHDSKDNRKLSKTRHTLQSPPAGGKNHDQYINSKEPICQASSLPTKQTKHIYAKMKVDGSFLEIADTVQLQEMTCSQQTSLYSRDHGKKIHVLHQDEKYINRNPNFHHISPNCERNEIKRDYRYQCQPIIEALPTSHAIGRQPPRFVYETVVNKKNRTESMQNCYQPKLHSPICDRLGASYAKRTSDSTPHPRTASMRESKQQTTKQPIGNASQMELVKDVPSHQDNARQSNAVQPSNDSDRRYRCDWPACTRAFRHYSFLVLHRRIHTGERPYNCSWEGCKKQFRRSDDYQRHYRVHTGVKPYPCSVCGKAFKRSDHRLFHYRAIHNMYKQ